MKRIVLTGGGTAGHVMPNLALIPELQKLGWEIHYIGSREGIEKELLAGAGLPYHPIATGKLRRYLSLKNLSDPFRVLGGLYQSFRLLKRSAPGSSLPKAALSPYRWSSPPGSTESR